ncbi:type II secretion system major pseudopilin GspG [Candidatus Dependentiae bacterium]|nr:type II secretion system major pseudopilin GspG [Candidatus Dependentiae bacterium]
MTYMAKQAKNGFTLIEILIAVAIVLIMGAVVVPGFMGYMRRARLTSAKSTIGTLETAINQFNADTGKYPSNLKDLIKRPTSDEAVAKKWVSPYIKGNEVPADPWGNRYQYTVTPGAEHAYELYSFGPNGRGAPKIEWISVWDL